MYVKVGRLVSKSFLEKLLRAVPPEDLKGLKSICVRTVPHKKTRKVNRRWGGIHGQQDGCGDKDESKVWIYLWCITLNVLNNLRYDHSNLYDSFVEKFADTLYHEIGHHVHSKTKEYKVLEAQIIKLKAKLRRAKKKQIAPSQFPPLNPQMDEYWNIKSQCNALSDEVERFANEYAQNVLSKAREMGLLNDPQLTDIRFFKIIRDRWIESWFKHYYKMKQRGRRQYIGWPTILGIFDHLRKCKLGNGVKYNLNELYEQVYGKYLTKENRRAFKKFVLKHVEPVWYVSKTGRRYPYFTETQRDELKRHKRETMG